MAFFEKYNFEDPSFACVRVTFPNSLTGHEKPEYYIIDGNYDTESFENMCEEYRAYKEELDAQNYRGCKIEIISKEELPKDFFEKRLKAAKEMVLFEKMKVSWYESVKSS